MVADPEIRARHHQIQEEREMLSTKLQAATATLAAAIAIAGIAVPSADATRNNHRYQSSGEAKRAHQQLCADLNLIMTTNQQEAKDAFEAGDPEGVKEHDEEATQAYNDARAQKCSWAARVAPPAPPGPTSAQNTGAAPEPSGIATVG
jgi:hypothetical protein